MASSMIMFFLGGLVLHLILSWTSNWDTQISVPMVVLGFEVTCYSCSLLALRWPSGGLDYLSVEDLVRRFLMRSTNLGRRMGLSSKNTGT